MRKILLVCVVSLWTAVSFAQETQWAAVEGKISTPWAEQVNPESPLPEHPRPQMVRNTWLNLNGLWDYVITPVGTSVSNSYDGKILVPFAVESSLSGVGRKVGKDSVLIYNRTITLPSDFRKKKVLLHFGAVDWKCEVSVNGTAIGSHTGGYDPFSFDITSALKRSGAQEIKVTVWDPSDGGPQPRGKQVKTPKGIWYTSVTGIWQTVWLEAVPQTYIKSVKITTDPDQGTVTLKGDIDATQSGDRLKMSVWDGTQKIAEGDSEQAEVSLTIPDAKRWSPASPFLYDVRITLVRKGKTVDEVRSYFGMRTISVAADSKGIQRMLLNDEMLFQYGPLDQGWWPDGLYT
ncbi:MAG: beta-galactosidase, partial [Bacteroidota bacterium]|nr:beta-galactosidase [Bacteroidota bacterium]